MLQVAAIVAAISVALAAPAAVAANGGRPAGGGDRNDDARARVACFGGVSELRLRSEDGGGEDAGKIQIELRLDARSRGVQAWRIVLLHERTIVYRASRRSEGARYAFRLRLNVPDWPGRETITARIANRSAPTCLVEATI
jgi:hypothetical protein